MSRSRPPALVIAAHGGTGSANARIEALAATVRDRRVAPWVVTTFHQGSPGFAEGLDGVDPGQGAVVVPLFTSHGYYVRSVLKPALGTRRGVPYVVTEPVGCHRDVPAAVARHLLREAPDVLGEPGSALVVLGHGTRRSRHSAGATLALGTALARRRVAARVQPAFLDQPPALESVLGTLAPAPTVVFPFLLGFGDHAAVDVPARVTARGRPVVVAPPLGAVPELVDWIVDLYRARAWELAG